MKNIFEKETNQLTVLPATESMCVAKDQIQKSSPVKKSQYKRRRFYRIAACILCCAVIGSSAGLGGAIIGNKFMAHNTQKTSTLVEGTRQTSVINVSQINTDKKMTAAEVYAANVNSTVGITTSVTTNYWGFQSTSAASGSGFIITSDGYILTNYHVIENANAITVSLYDGTTYDADLIGYDESNDIAVLKIEAEELTPVVLGDSDNLNVGDDVIAIGNPLGELTFSLTAGVVSALEREITLSNNVTMELIQTDCAINSGNSGGALFNLYGEVIGITNAKYSSANTEATIDNIGFAIPLNHIRSIVTSIIEKGYIAKPYIGVSIANSNSDIKGIYVLNITESSPAQKAGLQAGDIITAINDAVVSEANELTKIVASSSVGDTLKLMICRQNDTLEIVVTVDEQAQSALTTEDNQQNAQTPPNPGEDGNKMFSNGF